MRAEWIPGDVMGALLAAMMPANALALEASMATGLRIGDVLAITRQQCARGRFTVSEEKTGKHRRVYLPKKLQERMFAQAGRFFVFEHRLDEKKHRTRAAVYKDLRRVAALYRLEGKKIAAHVSPPYSPENMGCRGPEGRERRAAAAEPRERGGDHAVQHGRHLDKAKDGW